MEEILKLVKIKMDKGVTMPLLKVEAHIPKKHFKSANMALGHIAAAQKTAWLRNYGEEIFAKAMAEQFSLVAVEPDESKLPEIQIKEDVKEIIEELQEIEKELAQITADKAVHDSKVTQHKENKTLLRSLTKKLAKDNDNAELKEEAIEIETSIASYERTTLEFKASITRTKTTLAARKKSSGKVVAKEMRRIETTKRKNYIEAKIKANEFQHLFTECHMLVICYNITERSYDPSNWFPSSKGLTDGATSTGIIWSDDDLSTLKSTTFIGGGKYSRDEYVIHIYISDKMEELVEIMNEKLNANNILF